MLTDRFLVDDFTVVSAQEQQVDWFAHALSGELRPLAVAAAPTTIVPGDKDAYQHLSDATARAVDGDTRWDFLADPANPQAPILRLRLAGAGPEQLIATTGIGYRVDQRVPCLIRRRTAANTRFTAVYDLSGSGDAVRGVRASASPKRVIVTTAAGDWDLILGDEGVTCTPPPTP